jgi:hypothetical protein
MWWLIAYVAIGALWLLLAVANSKRDVVRELAQENPRAQRSSIKLAVYIAAFTFLFIWPIAVPRAAWSFYAKRSG